MFVKYSSRWIADEQKNTLLGKLASPVFFKIDSLSCGRSVAYVPELFLQKIRDSCF